MIRILLFAAASLWYSFLFSQCQPVLLEITSQAQIDNFAVQYPGCTRVDGSLWIQGQDIVSLEGLSQIETLSGELRIINTSITSFHGLHNLDSILSTFWITEDSLITDFSGMQSLKYVHSQMFVFGNPSLQNFSGLDSLNRIRIRLVVEQNSSLLNFTGLEQLGYIGENFRLVNNSSLENFQGLDNLDTVKNYFLIEGNGITNFSGLEALEYVGNNITLVNNPNLVSTEGLSGLTYTKYLSIGYNESLVSLNGLGSLEIVDNDLDVYNNPNLISLTGLNIANVSTLINLTLTDNAMLSYCTLPWVCDYIQERIGNIHGNAPGCGSGLEIRQICLVDTEEENETLNSTVFPNPVHDILFISPAEEVKAIVTNAAGIVQLSEVAYDKLDVSHLAPGIYVLQLQNATQNSVSKFIKH